MNRGKTMWGHSEEETSEATEVSEETKPAHSLIVNFQPLELWENEFLLFKHYSFNPASLTAYFRLNDYILKMHTLKLNPHWYGVVLEMGPLEGDQAMRVEPPWMGSVSWTKGQTQLPYPFHHMRPQELYPHKTPNPPFPWTFPASRTKRAKLLLFLSCPGSGPLWEQPEQAQPQQTNTGPHSDNFQLASLCWTPHPARRGCACCPPHSPASSSLHTWASTLP